MEDRFLIPANSKKSMLILGFFTVVDLVLFGIGVVITLFMLIVFQTSSWKLLIIEIIPALVSTFLVLPVPYYHNMLQLLTNLFNFIFKNRKYYWKGWCVRSEDFK